MISRKSLMCYCSDHATRNNSRDGCCQGNGAWLGSQQWGGLPRYTAVSWWRSVTQPSVPSIWAAWSSLSVDQSFEIFLLPCLFYSIYEGLHQCNESCCNVEQSCLVVNTININIDTDSLVFIVYCGIYYYIVFSDSVLTIFFLKLLL